jgi:formylglycine-generating enzyme
LAATVLGALILAGGLGSAGSAQAEPVFPAAVGQMFRDAPWAPEMVVLPAGRFLMGSSEAETTREKRAPGAAAYERPQRAVSIERPFAIGRSHVSVAHFDRFVKATRRTALGDCMINAAGKWERQPQRSYRDPAFRQNGRHPVVCVTWADARDYADWLSRETGHRYRLITEAEWEYAARAGTVTARWWGDSPEGLCRHANGADRSFDRAYPGDREANLSCDDGWAATSPAGRYRANPFRLNDMLGNAWQWTAECFRESLAAPSPDDPRCERRAIRGGSWHNYPNVLRAANRFWLPADMRSSSLGFRVARDPD